MDQYKALQEFIVAWMDELWWSMRDRVGALSMIESLQKSWQAAGVRVGEIARKEGMNFVKAVEAGHSMLGRTVRTDKNTIFVTTCPFWDQILAGNLEYGLRCEEFICAPFLTGIKTGWGANEATVETNLRLAHVNRGRLEYKLSKLIAITTSDSKIQDQISDIEMKLKQIPKQPACIFHVK